MKRKKLNIDVPLALKRLRLLTGRIKMTRQLGEYIPLFRGRSLEFDGFREYNFGDDAVNIDWKASVRTGKTLIRKYVEERKLEVFFLVDISNSMIFGSTPKLKNEYAAELAIALSYAVINADDKVGFALFNDGVVESFRPMAGRNQFFNFIRSLTNPNIYGGNYDLSAALKFPRRFLRHKGIIFLISDFIGLKDDSWQGKLKLLTSMFDVVCVMVRDPRDKILPQEEGQVYIEDPYSHKTLLLDPDITADVYKRYVEKQEADLRKKIINSRADFISVYTDELFEKPLLKLFELRKRRWR